MIKVNIDNKEIEVEEGCNVLQACEIAGVEIPRFCYHDRLSIAGNCRMCLVEVSPGPPKPQASCALPVAEGQIIKTNSEMVQNARKGVMEFLLVNHPLDCPICDQGGECDLQDQSMAFGSSESRFLENKRSVDEKNMGPLIKTHMTRCIHCTRCVRFSSEVAGVDELGALGRGETMEISSYLEKTLSSELSGCIIDLCPVGALTSKPYAFNSRPWELTNTESIDVLDGLGSNIRIDSRGNEVLRVLPRINEEINEEWISDKTRFAIDGLNKQRLDKPFLKNDFGKFEEISWDMALNVIKNKFKNIKPSDLAALSGDLVDVESLYSLKMLFDKIGCNNIDCRIDNSTLGEGGRSGYIFNSSIAGIEDSDSLLIIGSNPRIEAAVLNARIRKRYLMNKYPIGLLGEKVDLTYDYSYLGDSYKDLDNLISSKNNFYKILKNSKKPMIIIGSGAVNNENSQSFIYKLREFAEEVGVVNSNWNGFNFLNTSASRVGALDVGFIPKNNGLNARQVFEASEKGNLSLVWLLGVDTEDVKRLKNSFVIYQGHHGDLGAHSADLILPGAAYTEKSSIYVNIEGRPQISNKAIFPPGEAREDWKIIRAVSEAVNFKLPFDNLLDLRNHIFNEFDHLSKIDQLSKTKWSKFGKKGITKNFVFQNVIPSFYMTCPISRSSETMAECMNAQKNNFKSY